MGARSARGRWDMCEGDERECKGDDVARRRVVVGKGWRGKVGRELRRERFGSQERGERNRRSEDIARELVLRDRGSVSSESGGESVCARSAIRLGVVAKGRLRV